MNIPESRVDEMNQSTNHLEKRKESYRAELPEYEPEQLARSVNVLCLFKK